MSDDAVKRAVGGAQAVRDADEIDELWQACPVVPLGHRDGVFIFLSAAGEKRDIAVREMSVNMLTALFSGDTQWLEAKFPEHDRHGNPVPRTFKVRDSWAALMRRCATAGLWDEETAIRGRGVWRGDRGEDLPVCHCGDQLLVDQAGRLKFVPSGKHWGRAIYPAAAVTEPPALRAVTAGEVAPVLGWLDAWGFESAAVKRLFHGWIVLAALGQAPRWRVHVMITAKHGAGKSSLIELIRALLGPQSRGFNDFSEAGLRQTFSGEARALCLDEGEGETGNLGRIEQVILFLRRMAGGEGLQAVRGSAGGTSQHFSAAAPALLAAINPPALMPQDRSRFFVAELAIRGDYQGALAAIASAPALSPLFRARALLGWRRFRQNLALYHAALLEAGCDPRLADKFGALLAASDMMRFDETPSAEGCAGAVDDIRDLIREAVSEDEEDSDARQCLTRLLSRQIEHWRGGSKSTIGRLVQDGLDGVGGVNADLGIYGLRLDKETMADGRPHWWLAVANRHSGLDQIFGGTRWQNGAWRTALLRLEDARRSAKPWRFEGVQSRAVEIPQKFLPMKGGGDDEF